MNLLRPLSQLAPPRSVRVTHLASPSPKRARCTIPSALATPIPAPKLPTQQATEPDDQTLFPATLLTTLPVVQVVETGSQVPPPPFLTAPSEPTGGPSPMVIPKSSEVKTIGRQYALTDEEFFDALSADWHHDVKRSFPSLSHLDLFGEIQSLDLELDNYLGYGYGR